MWPGSRPTTMPSFILIHPTVCGGVSDVCVPLYTGGLCVVE